MIAARYLAPNRIEPVETEMPVPGEGEALLRVEACGICGSDLAIISGGHPRAKAPLTIGHEFCGEVVQLKHGSGALRVGDRVTFYPLISCGTCYVCRHGQPHVCRNLRVYGFDAEGGMAEYVKVPLRGLLKIPAQMPTVTAALLEPLAVGIHSVARVPVSTEDTVLVIGAGPIGLVVALVLRHYGVDRVLITDRLEFRVELARRLGLDAYNTEYDNLAAIVERATAGEGAAVIFECAGTASSATEMTALARCRGAIVNVSVFKQCPAVDVRAINFKELSLVGSRVYTLEDFERSIEVAPQLPLAQLVSHRLPISRVADAYQVLRFDPQVSKVLIEPGGVSP